MLSLLNITMAMLRLYTKLSRFLTKTQYLGRKVHYITCSEMVCVCLRACIHGACVFYSSAQLRNEEFFTQEFENQHKRSTKFP